MKEIFDVKDVATYLNISIAKVYQLVDTRSIPHSRLENKKNSRILFRKQSIDNWLLKKEKEII